MIQAIIRFLLIAAMVVSGSAHAYMVYIYAGGPKKVSAEAEQPVSGEGVEPAPADSDPEESADALDPEAEAQD